MVSSLLIVYYIKQRHYVSTNMNTTTNAKKNAENQSAQMCAAFDWKLSID